MPQSLCNLLVHLVFGTKDRRPLLTPDIRDEVHSYLGGILLKWDSQPLTIGGVDDHVHVLFRLSKNHALKNIIQQLKTGSSTWLRGKSPNLRGFHWQGGYGAFSVSPSDVDRLRYYVQNQEEHHRHVSFKDELRSLLRMHGLTFDERYLWD